MARHGHRLTAGIVSVMLAVAACGGGSKSTPSTTSKAAPSSTAAPQTGGASVMTGPVHATLTASNHSPVAGKNWPYSVHVTDVSGHPLTGTVRIQFSFGGRVVGTDHPPVHPLKNGRWHDLLQFPRAAVGFPLTFQVVVHTSAGSVTLNWPVSVKS
jgi:hypothetical protein